MYPGHSANKILLFIKIPPPITGATIMNKYVYDSILLKSNFKSRSICISYKNTIRDKRKFNLNKTKVFFMVIVKLIIELAFNKPVIIYFQISPTGKAFLRDILFVLLIKMSGKSIIYHLHGQGISTSAAHSKLIKLFYSFVFRNEFLIIVSTKLIRDIKDVYLGNPYVVPNAVKEIPSHFLYKNKKINVKTRIIFLSNLFLFKGVYDLIAALKIIKCKGYQFDSFIIGSEGDISKEQIQIKIKENQLDNDLFYIGEKYDYEKYIELLKSDIFVFLSSNDIWGLVILEAMQCELPVISYNVGAVSDMVEDGITGFLVEKKNIKQLVEKIEILIKDESLRREMGKAGRQKFLANFTIDIFERNMENVFNDVLKKIRG